MEGIGNSSNRTSGQLISAASWFRHYGQDRRTLSIDHLDHTLVVVAVARGSVTYHRVHNHPVVVPLSYPILLGHCPNFGMYAEIG
jgi:hypothetical protein